MKERYALFVIDDDCEPAGGWGDFKQTGASIVMLRELALGYMHADRFQIVDLELLRVVDEGRPEVIRQGRCPHPAASRVRPRGLSSDDGEDGLPVVVSGWLDVREYCSDCGMRFQ